MVKNLSVSAGGTRDADLTPGQEDPLEKAMALAPVFLPGKFHGQWRLVSYCPRGCKELDMTERLSVHACICVDMCRYISMKPLD